MAIDAEGLRERLLTCLAVPAWADRVLAAGPFQEAEALVAAATAAATPLAAEELSQALAAHPRIGERRDDGSREARFSAAEQAASADPDAVLAELLRVGNAAYERRFDRVFLIRAAGRGRPEIIAELIRRLANDETAELEEVAEQLRQIMALRLRALLAEPEPEPAA